MPSDAGIGIAQRAEFVFLVLKQIRVDCPGPDAILLHEARHFRHIVQAARKIPKHVQR